MAGEIAPETAGNTTDLFEIIRTTRSMRRLKPDPVPNELIRKILEAGDAPRAAATCSAGGSWLSAIQRSRRLSGPCTSAPGMNRSPLGIGLVNLLLG
jgi:hypothetical protein